MAKNWLNTIRNMSEAELEQFDRPVQKLPKKKDQSSQSGPDGRLITISQPNANGTAKQTHTVHGK